MIDFHYIDPEIGTFIWDTDKAKINIIKHGIAFRNAVRAFADPQRFVLKDPIHSEQEPRFFCVGRVNDKILTVRFTYREGMIRIIGAAQWRKWRKIYETKNSLR